MHGEHGWPERGEIRSTEADALDGTQRGAYLSRL
jgi:hypothetical protein